MQHKSNVCMKTNKIITHYTTIETSLILVIYSTYLSTSLHTNKANIIFKTAYLNIHSIQQIEIPRNRLHKKTMGTDPSSQSEELKNNSSPLQSSLQWAWMVSIHLAFTFKINGFGSSPKLPHILPLQTPITT